MTQAVTRVEALGVLGDTVVRVIPVDVLNNNRRGWLRRHGT